MKGPILSLLLFLPALAQAEMPPSFTATYALYNSGIQVAQQRRELTVKPKGGVYRATSKTVGLIALFKKLRIEEETRWKLLGENIRPVTYSYFKDTGKKQKSIKIDFDWKNRQLSNTTNDESWQLALRPRTIDVLLYQLVMQRDLLSGAKGPLAYTIAEGHKLRKFFFKARGKETLETELGSLETLKMERRHKPGSTRETLFWCAPKLHYLPVKIFNKDKKGGQITALLKELNIDKKPVKP